MLSIFLRGVVISLRIDGMINFIAQANPSEAKTLNNKFGFICQVEPIGYMTLL